MHCQYRFNVAAMFIHRFMVRMLFKYGNWQSLLFYSYSGMVVCFIKVNLVFLRRNFWSLEPIKIYKMGSNGKLIFILGVLEDCIS